MRFISKNQNLKKNWFINLDESKKSILKFVDDSKLVAQGIRKVVIKRKDDKHSFITDRKVGYMYQE